LYLIPALTGIEQWIWSLDIQKIIGRSRYKCGNKKQPFKETGVDKWGME